MARASGNQESTFSGINVTPLTDVMLVLLITFLLTASSFESDTLSVPLPRLVETQEIEKYGLITPPKSLKLGSRSSFRRATAGPH